MMDLDTCENAGSILDSLNIVDLPQCVGPARHMTQKFLDAVINTEDKQADLLAEMEKKILLKKKQQAAISQRHQQQESQQTDPVIRLAEACAQRFELAQTCRDCALQTVTIITVGK